MLSRNREGNRSWRKEVGGKRVWLFGKGGQKSGEWRKWLLGRGKVMLGFILKTREIGKGEGERGGRRTGVLTGKRARKF